MSQVVDTHGLVWFLEGNARLGPHAKTVLDTTDETLVLPATVIAEACWMIQRGKTSITSVAAIFTAIDTDTRFHRRSDPQSTSRMSCHSRPPCRSRSTHA